MFCLINRTVQNDSKIVADQKGTPNAVATQKPTPPKSQADRMTGRELDRPTGLDVEPLTQPRRASRPNERVALIGGTLALTGIAAAGLATAALLAPVAGVIVLLALCLMTMAAGVVVLSLISRPDRRQRRRVVIVYEAESKPTAPDTSERPHGAGS